MDNNTPTQADNQIDPATMRASLGFATSALQQGLSQEQPQALDATQQPNPAPQPPTNQETPKDLLSEMQGLESRIMDEIGVLKSEIQKASPKDSGHELENLKKEIEKIINQ